MNAQLTVIQPAELVRQSSDVAGLCRDIVAATAMRIGPNSYVKVEGWQSIAAAHGCLASARDVHKVDGGIVATGELRRMQDGALLATAEGFVGDDEVMWAKRTEHARRGMAQTRAISRVCRSAFAHVVVLMNAGLSTTPAEEVPEGGFQQEPEKAREPEKAQVSVLRQPNRKVKSVELFEGVSKREGKPDYAWKRWKITLADGAECGTFDAELALRVEAFKARQVDVDVSVSPGKKAGTFDLVAIEESDDIPQ